MSIKSYFFPKEALQGEDLPSHIIWSDLKFDRIKIDHSTAFTLKEVYNVSDKDMSIKEGLILIDKVEVDGYLGIVFSSKILSEKAVDKEIQYSFILGDEIIERLTSSIHLFRPDVVLSDVPNQILVTLPTGEISPRIVINNLGEGTAIIDLETTSDSELQKCRPQFVEAFIKEYVEGVESGIAQLKTDFKEYSTLLDTIQMYLTSPVKFEKKSLKRFEEFENEFTTAIAENEEFINALSEMLAEIFLRNSEFSNLYQFVLDYINSIGKEKMLVRDPFNVITLPKKPSILKVKIKCIDLLKQMCTTMTLPPISVSCKQAGEIALFKLFKWGGEKK